MKIQAMGIDKNGRSNTDALEVPLNKVSETESLSARQPGANWRLGPRAISSDGYRRTDPRYVSAGGIQEMHLGGEPHFIGLMAGHAEITMQDGVPFRLVAGEFLYVRPGSLHHSDFPSLVQPIIFNLYLPGTPDDIQPLKIV